MRTLRYDQLPIWETKRRIADLEEFLDVVQKYLQSLTMDPHLGEVSETDESPRIRSQINRRLARAEEYVTSARGVPILRFRQPGGASQDVNLLTNLFRLHEYSNSHQDATDVIERAIGTYATDQFRAWRRTLNPAFWLGRGLDWLAAGFFSLVGRAGFDADRFAESSVGRVIRLLIYIVGALASIAVVLEFLGWRDAVRQFIVGHQ